jgi:hypothetical protein
LIELKKLETGANKMKEVMESQKDVKVGIDVGINTIEDTNLEPLIFSDRMWIWNLYLLKMKI